MTNNIIDSFIIIFIVTPSYQARPVIGKKNTLEKRSYSQV